MFASCGKTAVVTVNKSSRGTVESTVTSVNAGTVEAEQSAELAFGTVGRVKSLKIKIGDTVKAGTILADVENKELISAVEIAKRELERMQQLKVVKGMSASSVDSAERDLRFAEAAYEKSLVRAPFDGVITELNMDEGQLSQITAIIPKAPIRIVDIAPRYVTAEIDEVDLPKVKAGQKARVTVAAARREPFYATVRRVIPFVSSIREQDRTTQIELEVNSEGILLPVGASADVDIITDAHDKVITVPMRAVLGRGQERYLFVLNEGRAQKRSIKLGLYNFDRAEVIDGLQDGETLIIPDAIDDLQDGLKVTAK